MISNLVFLTIIAKYGIIKEYEILRRIAMSEFKRPIPENYGPSYVKLEKLDMAKGFETISVSGTEIVLPVLDVKRYFPNAEAYAFIERLQNAPVTMVDVLYSYTEIGNQFEKDENFRREVLTYLNRKRICSTNLEALALTLTPNRRELTKNFSNSINSAILDGVGAQVLLLYRKEERDEKVELPPDPKAREDGLFVELMKALYEEFSGEEARRPTDPQIRKVTYRTQQKVVFMKTGAVVIGDEEVPKYSTNFQSNFDMEMEKTETKENQEMKDFLTFCISGVDEKRLMTSREYFERFQETILSNGILEAFSGLNTEKKPKFCYVGKYNEIEAKVMVHKPIKRYFDNINEQLVPTRPEDEGR